MDGITGLFSLIISQESFDIIYRTITETYPELLTFTLLLSLYGIFVWLFYRNLSDRDLFELDLRRFDLQRITHRRLRKAWNIFLYVFKYGVIFPMYVVFWFIIFSLLLFIIVKNVAPREIILASISLVSAVRITAYLKRDLSRDMAKLLPLGVLAMFLSDPDILSMTLLVNRLSAIPSLGIEIVQFISFSITLEWLLRSMHFLFIRARNWLRDRN